jgi:hypothetical protein
MQNKAFGSLLKVGFGAAAFLFFISASAQAELIYGVGGTGESPTSVSLFNFNTTTPGTLNTIGTITGITAGQTVEGITFSPTGALYLMGYNTGTGFGQIYTVNLATGAATAVNAAAVDYGFATGGASSLSFGLQFTSGNAIQVIDGGGDLFQINAATGTVNAGGTSAAYSPSQPLTPQWTGLSANGAGTLYTIDEINNVLGRIDSVSAGTSNVTSLGSFGITTRGPATMGFEISNLTGTFYLQTDTDDADVADGLYTLNPTTGLATLLGQVGGSSNFNTIDIAIQPVPEPATITSIGLGGGMLLALLRFRRRKS